MEKQGLFLSSLAGVLNAAGSALVNVYDTVMAVTTGVAPGEKGTLNARLKDYEKKIENLYSDVGKKVVSSKDAAETTEAVEAGTKLVAEYRAEMEKIKQSIKKIEEEEKAAAAAKKEAARERAAAPAKSAPETKVKPVAKAEESPATKRPEVCPADIKAEPEAAVETATETIAEDEPEAATEAAGEETREAMAEVISAPEPEMEPQIETEAQAEAEAAAEAEAEAETEAAAVTVESTESEADTKKAAEARTKKAATAEELDQMLKSDLLKLCGKKKIKANEKMTKEAIIKLILAG